MDWLADRDLSQGDVLHDAARSRLVAELAGIAVLYTAKGLSRHRQIWRPANPVGLRAFALVLIKERGGTRLDILPTRERAALMERMRERMNERREANPDMVASNNRKQRDRARRAKSEIRKRVYRENSAAEDRGS